MKNLDITQAAHHAETKRPQLWLSRQVVSTFCVLFFISAQLIAVSHWDSLKPILRPYTAPVGVGLGIEQMWLMFSPDVRRTNYHSTAVFTFADGTCRLYEFPRMDKRDYWTRFRQFKLQKLFDDIMANPVGKPYRPAIAEYIISCFENPQNKVERVSFIFNYTNTPKIDSDKIPPREALPEHFSKANYFEYIR
ncbi:MAG: hypothetical protein SFY67_01035 [Candidatus Melainabacteria bacterium]|nr:hypothetical protein [Candidatus Melainabacteria bacterium]